MEEAINNENIISPPPPPPKPPASQLESLVLNAKKLNFWENIDDDTRNNYVKAVTAGLAVSLAMVPEATSFSFVAGVSPLVGLWTTVILGFFAAAFGGRPGICSSASGACSIVVAALCQSHGAAYLAGCAVLAGVFQVAGGVLGLGKFIRLVPHPVMLGFVNGLAIVMLRAQLTHFQSSAGQFYSLLTKQGQASYGVAAATIVMTRYTIPKLRKKVKKFKAVPPTLGAVAFVSIISKVLKLPVKTLADVAGKETFRGGLLILPKIGLPSGFWTPFIQDPISALKIILPYAITMAAVGSIESLLTLQLLDGIVDDGERGSTKKEVIAQGIGNMAAGMTGGIGGCALVGQSLICVQSGGAGSRLSGMSVSVFLALGLVAFSSLLGSVPIVSLAAVMLLVCQSQFSWSSLRILNQIPKLDAMTILLVSYITVKDDLAKAVLVGTITSALGFAWKQSTNIYANTSYVTNNDTASETKWKRYEFHGALFFGSTQRFASLVTPKDDPEDTVLDFRNCRIADHSALEIINNIFDKYNAAADVTKTTKTLHVQGLSSDVIQLLQNVRDTELPSNVKIEKNPSQDPVYMVAEKPSVYKNVAVPKVP